MSSSQLARESGISPSHPSYPLPDSLEDPPPNSIEQCDALLIRLVLKVVRVNKRVQQLRAQQSRNTPQPEWHNPVYHPRESAADNGPPASTLAAAADLRQDYAVQGSPPAPVTPNKASTSSTVYTPRGPANARLNTLQRQKIIKKFLLHEDRCDVSYKREIQLAHILEFATSPDILEKLEKAFGIRPGGLSVNTRRNYLERMFIDIVEIMPGLNDKSLSQSLQNFICFTTMDTGFSSAVTDEQDVVYQYFYLSLDHSDNVHDHHATFIRLRTEPDMQQVFEEAMEEHGTADRGYVQACHLPKTFAVAQTNPILIKPNNSLPRVFSKAHPKFVTYRSGKVLNSIQEKEPDRDIENEIRGRLKGTDDESLIEEVLSSIDMTRIMYTEWMSETQSQGVADDGDARYLPWADSPLPSSDGVEAGPSTRSPYNMRPRIYREGAYCERSSSISDPDDEDEDMASPSHAEMSTSTAQELISVAGASADIDSENSPLLGKRALGSQSSVSDMSDDSSSSPNVSPSPRPPPKKSRCM
ncbi:hypothetical protein FISHEDRAFT_76709 [Fistulina hepatica ATCC 64428]|uniref:Uncharacterized protein n=1 Tax=Fistulina hepatica ATCC 64428 TaxID=1128425 RepID=A0A0D7A600_9AGAR|nr:hypothetical protein FISHEDRAFT_76709 [Fistulina hepatica ATCC 64428]